MDITPESNISETLSLNEFVKRELKTRNWTPKDFAKTAKLPVYIIEWLINGTEYITDEILQGIGRVLKSRSAKLHGFIDDSHEEGKFSVH